MIQDTCSSFNLLGICLEGSNFQFGSYCIYTFDFMLTVTLSIIFCLIF